MSDELLREAARKIASNVCSRMSEFGADLPLHEAEAAAFAWLNVMRDSSDQAFDILIKSEEALDELASTIVMSIMLDLAEERPGTNPWAHERNVPLPMTFAYSQIQILSAITSMAISNQDLRWAENSNANVIALSGLLGQITSHTPIAKDNKPLKEGIIFVPQPAMAYVARFLRNTAEKIDKDKWLPALEGPLSRHDDVPGLFRQHAAILEKLTRAFGRPVGPPDMQ